MNGVYRLSGFLCFTLAISLGGLSPATAQDNSIETTRCNTKIDWHSNWREAFELAKKTGKPLYVLHLSGNLKNEKFT